MTPLNSSDDIKREQFRAQDFYYSETFILKHLDYYYIGAFGSRLLISGRGGIQENLYRNVDLKTSIAKLLIQLKGLHR